jgi:hypothetical protein
MLKIALATLILLLPTLAEAGTSCSTRKSGSTTITSCSSSGQRGSTTCRSYYSGSTKKTYCS